MTVLRDILEGIKSDLAQASQTPGHAYRELCFATAQSDGLPNARMVILRDVELAPFRLTIFSDNRARKCTEIRKQNTVQIVAYDAERKVQLRMSGATTLHVNDPVSEVYRRNLSERALNDYAGRIAPGEMVSSPDYVLDAKDHVIVSNFAVMKVFITDIDWLSLSRAGHQRAKFCLSGNAFKGDWVAP